MALDHQIIEFELPVSKRKIKFRSEKLIDDVKGLKIATEGAEDKNDRSSIFFALQKVKLALAIIELDGEPLSVNNYKEYSEVIGSIMKYPQDYKVLDQLYIQLNGDIQEAEAFVKNLLKAPVS